LSTVKAQDDDLCGDYGNGNLLTYVQSYYAGPGGSYWGQITEYVNFYYEQDTTIWQIGFSHKAGFETVQDQIRVLITDTINPYPAFESHSFVISVIPDFWEWSFLNYGGPLNFLGCYQMESDSLEDWLSFEYSFDNGASWHDMTAPEVFSENHPLYDSHLAYNLIESPILTGSTNGWKRFYLHLGFDPGLNPAVPKNYPNGYWDTFILIKVTFTSGANPGGKGGVMFSNLALGLVFGQSVQDNYGEAFKVWTSGNRILADSEEQVGMKLSILDLTGRKCINAWNLDSGVNEISSAALKPGVYIYVLGNSSGQIVQTGKLMVE